MPVSPECRPYRALDKGLAQFQGYALRFNRSASWASSPDAGTLGHGVARFQGFALRYHLTARWAFGPNASTEPR